MPYIKKIQRDIYEDQISQIAISLLGAPDRQAYGELNYIISSLIHRIVTPKNISYTRFNGIIGALECAKQEFYRRMVAGYEDKKRVENGDI